MPKKIRYVWNGLLLGQEISLIIFMVFPELIDMQFLLVLFGFAAFCMNAILWKPGVRLTGVVVRICIGAIITLLSGYFAQELGLYMTAMGLVSLACLFDFWLEHRQRMKQAMRAVTVVVAIHYAGMRKRLP